MCFGVIDKRSLAAATAVLTSFASNPALAGNPEDDAFRIHYGTSGALMGLALAPAPDMNGDGVADYIIGAPKVANFTGQVHVVSGADGSDLHIFSGDSTLSFFGFAISPAGDVDGDGYEDIVIGAPIYFVNDEPVGAAYVYSGQDGHLLWSKVGAETAGIFGWAVAACGDVNDDGYADVAIAAPAADIGGQNGGAIYIFAGPNGTLLHTFAGAGSDANYGLSLANAGDLNGDGFDDLLAGLPGSNKARLLDVHNNSLIRTLSSDEGGTFGWSVADAGDVNGDGVRDQIIGAPDADGGGAMRGEARVFSGADGTPIHTFTGPNRSHLGYAVAGGQDVDGDGYADLVLGAPGYKLGSVNRGRVEIRSGLTGEMLDVINGGPSYGWFGEAVAAIGDVTGDGLGDIIVGQSIFGGFNSGAAFVFGYTPSVFALAGGGNFMTLLAHPSFVLATDINNDGSADAITVHPESNQIAIRRGKGDGTFHPSQFYNAGNLPVTVAACDIDHDGDKDLVIAGQKLVFLRRVGATYQPSGTLSVGHKPCSIAAADFNHDGRVDLAVTNRLDGTVSVLINNRHPHWKLSNQFKTAKLYTVGANPVHIQAGQIDGDTYVDLAVANSGSNEISTLINRGDGRFFPQFITQVQNPPSCLALADFNNDGIVDLASISHDSDFVSVRQGSSDGHFGEAQFFGVAHAPSAIVATDLDVNGRPDLAVTCSGDSCISLLLNDPVNGFAAWPAMFTATGPVWISAGDLDGDADQDLLSVSDDGFITAILNTWY